MAYYRKSGVLRGKKTFVRYTRNSYKKGIKQANNKMGAYGRAPTLQKVISLINQATSKTRKLTKAQEKKESTNVELGGPVIKWAHSQAEPTFFFKNFNGIFDTITQGTTSMSRIGNKFLLKKLLVQVMIHPSDNYLRLYASGDTWRNFPNHLGNSYQGYTTFWIGKRIDGVAFDDTLNLLLQNGNSSVTPKGRMYDQLYRLNKDVYKVYYKRVMKCGMSEVPDFNTSWNVPSQSQQADNEGNYSTTATGPIAKFQNIQMMPNNDYKLTHKFHVDITKFIGKDATIKYNDGANNAIVPSTLRGLAMWTTWSPCVGDTVKESNSAALQSQTANDSGSGYASTPESFFHIHTTTMFEYMD